MKSGLATSTYIYLLFYKVKNFLLVLQIGCCHCRWSGSQQAARRNIRYRNLSCTESTEEKRKEKIRLYIVTKQKHVLSLLILQGKTKILDKPVFCCGFKVITRSLKCVLTPLFNSSFSPVGVNRMHLTFCSVGAYFSYNLLDIGPKGT